MSVFGAALVGCGAVSFVDPDVDLRESLTIGEGRRIAVAGDPSTYVLAVSRVRAIPVEYRLELDDGVGRVAIPSDTIAELRCADDRICWLIAMPPLERAPEELVLVVPDLEHESRAPLSLVPAPPLEMSVLITGGGRGVEVGVDDPVVVEARAQSFSWSRTYDMIATPGACGDPLGEDDPRWLRGARSRQVIEAPLPTGADPALCVEVRPTVPSGVPVSVRRSVGPVAQLETFDHTYAPPVELSPLVWMVVSDLQLPSESACTRNESRLERAVAQAADAIAAEAEATVTVRALPLLRLAVDGDRPCQQAPGRRLDVAGLLAQVDADLDATFGDDARVRTLVVYANNLDTEPSPRVLEDLDAWESAAAADPRRPIALFSVTPPRGAIGAAIGGIEFAAANEPAFAAAMLASLRNVWPFRTLIHGPDTRVPLVGEALRDRFLLYRVVTSVPEIEPIGTPYGRVLEPDVDGPAYRVVLPRDVLAPASRFLRPRVTVTWAGCVGACTEPPPGRSPPAAWALDP